MPEQESDLKKRTKQFAVRVVHLVDSLPRRLSTEIIGKQVLRSATSVGANYCAACRARSRAEFCSKLGIVEEEGDETIYWLELLVEAGIVQKERLDELIQEANELVAITVASIRTSRNNGAKHASK